MSDGFNVNDLDSKFAEISEILQSLKEENVSKLEDTNRIVNNLCESVNKDEVVSKISNLETIIARIAGDYDVSLHSVHENVMNYLASIKDECESADIKMNNFAFEFNSLKSEVEQLFSEFKSIYGVQNDNFSSICNGIYSRFDSIMNSVGNTKDADSISELKNNIEGLQHLMQELLSAFADKNSDNPVTIDIKSLNPSGLSQEDFDNLNKNLESEINKIKNQINFVFSDLMENIYNYYEKLSAQFKPVNEAVLDFSKINFDEIFEKIAEQKNSLKSDDDVEQTPSIDAALFDKIEASLKEVVLNSSDKILSVLSTLKTVVPQVGDDDSKAAAQVIQTSLDIDNLTSIFNSELNSLKDELGSRFDNIHKHLDEVFVPKFTDVENKQNEILEKLNSINEVELLNSLKEKLDNLNDKLSDLECDCQKVSPVELSQESVSELSEEEKSALLNFNSGLNEIKNCINSASKAIADKISNFNSDKTNFDIINQKLDLLAVNDDVKEEIESYLSEIKNTVKDQQKFLNTVNILEALNSLDDIKNMKGIEQLSKLSNIISVEKLNALNKLTLLENLQNLDRINELENIPKLSGMIDLQKKLQVFVEDLDKKLNNLSDNSENISNLSKKVENVLSEDFKAQIAEIESNFKQELEAVKTTIMKHVLNVFEQLSFVVEGEEIKDFVDEKTQDVLTQTQNIIEKTQSIYDVVTKNDDVTQEIRTIKHAVDSLHPLEYKDIEEDIKHLNEVSENVSNTINANLSKFSENLTAQVENMGRQFNQMRVGSEVDDGSYSYSMQDVESDIAHLRLALNNIKNVVEENSLKEITQYVNEIVQQVESMKFNITQDDIFKIKVDVEKMYSDVLSISSRINKLLLASDESAVALSTAMDSFKQVMSDLYEGMKKLDYTEITNTLDKIKTDTENTAKQTNNTVESVAKLSLWADDTDEKLTDISETLEKLKKAMPSNENVLDELETKFAKQQQRIESLEDKLDELIALSSDNDSSNVSKKLNDIDKQLTRLNRSIERLTSYVDEE